MAYGYNTRSYLRSTEHRQMQKERAKATAEYEARQDRTVTEVGPFCTCAQYGNPHKPHGGDLGAVPSYAWFRGRRKTALGEKGSK